MQLKTKIAAGAGLVGLATAALVTVMAAAPFDSAQQPIGYVGQPVSSSTNVADGKARMFAIDYNAATLGGNLHSFPISSGGTIGATDNWIGGAEAMIAAQALAGTRNIVTMSDAASPAGIPFTWAALSAAQRAMVDSKTAAVTSSTVSPVLDYLRGVKTAEGTTYRVRTSSLGTLIHSTPVYWKDATGNETVYVGANDGMMHAIDAVTGKERFAYIPRTLLPRLEVLSSKAFTPQYYVDGRLDVRKFTNKTILVGTLGGGGKAVFALDVSNGATGNEAGAAAKVMWEVNNKSAGFANLGDTYGAPVLTRLLKKKAVLPTEQNEYYDALVMGNGYNNTGSGAATLLVIDAQTGKLIKEIATPGGSATAPNGLSSPSLWDTDEDGVKDAAYAGDIDGNMWKFNLNDLTASPVQLHAREDSDPARAITTAPGLTAHPSGGVLVAFVTGRLYTADDMKVNNTVHSAYGIRDKASSSLPLLEQTLSEYTFGAGASAIRVRTSSNKPMNWITHRGWKVPLPKGERVVGDGIFIMGDVFQFFSTNPMVDTTAKPPGENWWMQLNWRNGGTTGEVIFDLNNDAKYTSDDMVLDSLNKPLAPVGRHMGGGVRSQLIGLSAGGVDVYQSNFDQNDAPKPDTVDVSTATVGGERGVAGGHFDTDIFCYNKCGGATEVGYFGGVSAASGQYAIGREATYGDVANQNYVHVHEYDDIYDVLGLNMLHPSQDEQRLAPTVASTQEAYAPDLPTLMSQNAGPASATVVSTTNWTAKTYKGIPYAYSNYSEGKRTAVTGYPKSTVATDGTLTFINQVTYTTTRQSVEVRNIKKVSGTNNTYSYEERTIRSTWTTTQTTTDVVPNTRFKVLVANQAYSPAIKLSIEGSDGTGTGGTYKGVVTGYQTGGGLSVATLPAYKMNNIKDLQVSMPLDAFVARDWVGNGILRNGVHPIKPQCAGVVDGISELGPKGEWRNGALTVQVVKADIAQSDIQLNVANRPDLGYRLITSKLPEKLIAEYLIYWHHPTNLCMGDPGWTYAAAPDNKASTAGQGVPAAGSLDPKGSFQQGNGDPAPPTKPATNPPPVVVKNPDGSTTTTTIKYTDLASGGYVIETTVKISWPVSSGSPTTGIVTGGAVSSGSSDPACTVNCKGGVDPTGPKLETATLGRINWRELQR
ncbi:pilus assembly protein [Massilia pseudoviolaceinigra]|uniref:pilus assembly protein n=1 Tax=Massilia pseudoviolaceinigra TaxID=3057165 RepID=UPI0027969E87|nr:PilC/PilY family type IV pilus protein [Massilia sp. CCM 9206]MDQ1920655.1 PilC/PilY family type IV pilus protein [Massilia sp. CCM 9206]